MPVISDTELKRFGQTDSLVAKVNALFMQQKTVWGVASDNYRLLEQVQVKKVEADSFTFICQYNPGRVRSSAADTSAVAIRSRPCFLCTDNRPVVQCSIPFGDDLEILINPFPIFPRHLTIPSVAHIPQQFEGNAGKFVDLSRSLEGYTVLYNGPKCGASAPDHLHFQAGLSGTMPIGEVLKRLPVNQFRFLAGNMHVNVLAVEGAFLRFLVLRSAEKEHLLHYLETVTGILGENSSEEPMINILSWYNAGEWEILLFPRIRQRPFQYFAEGDDRLLVSPAAVEMGGMLILPREEDFRKISPVDIESIFNQVCIGTGEFEILKKKISDQLR